MSTNAAKKGRFRPALAGLVALTAAILALLTIPDMRMRMDHAAFDAMQRLWPRVYMDVPVRIVDIDEQSLARLGQWPWPRDLTARLITRLRDLGAASIALDVVLAEPDRSAPARMAKAWNVAPAIRDVLTALPDPDAVLAQAMASGDVVSGFVAGEHGLGRETAAKARFIFSGPPPASAIPDLGRAIPSLHEFEQAAAGNGAAAFTPDGDGIIRRVPLLVRLGEKLYPSLSLEALRVALGKRNILITSVPETGAVSEIALGALKIPVDASGALHLHYTKPQPKRFVPAWAVLDGSADPASLAGHVVFIGASAKGLLDLRYTALGDLVPGVIMHAEAAEAMQLGKSLHRPDWSEGAETLAALIAGLILIAAASRLPALTAGSAALAVIVALAATSALLFLDQGMLIDPIPAAAAALAAYSAAALVRHRQDEAERAFVRSTFARYISPNLVRHLLDNPESLAVGGARRECSFVMTDLAGFTGMVEKSDPSVLLDILNGYIDGMVRIAFRHQGTLDRIVGDAVAVMFSAPVEQKDHAARAIACALEMDAFCRDYAAKMAEQGHALGITRIGVNTGWVTIGNVGGGSVSDYRALGDAVNAAARLETVNRHLGTRICVSGTTTAQCPDFHGRPVGDLVLKGKAEALPAFEPLAPGCEVPAYAAAFELMRDEDPGAAAAMAALAPADPLAAFHSARLDRGETGIRVVLSEK